MKQITIIISFFLLGCQEDINPILDDNSEVTSPLESVIGIDSIFIKKQFFSETRFNESIINFEYQNEVLVSKIQIDSIFTQNREPTSRFNKTDLFYENTRLFKLNTYSINDNNQVLITVDSLEYDFENKLILKYSYEFENQESFLSSQYTNLNIDSFVYDDNNKIIEIFHFEDSINILKSKNKFVYENGNITSDTLWKNFNDTLLYIDKIQRYDHDNFFNYKLLDQSLIGWPQNNNNEIYKAYTQFYSSEPYGFVQSLFSYNEMGLTTTILKANAFFGGSTDSISIMYKYE